MKFLRSFHSHHFGGKPVLAPVNVGFFLALPKFLLDDRLYFASTDRLVSWVLYFSAIVFETTIPCQ